MEVLPVRKVSVIDIASKCEVGIRRQSVDVNVTYCEICLWVIMMGNYIDDLMLGYLYLEGWGQGRGRPKL